jgi:hypothetical protein
LLTTAKEFVKLPPSLALLTTVLRVRLVWLDEEALDNFLSTLV